MVSHTESGGRAILIDCTTCSGGPYACAPGGAENALAGPGPGRGNPICSFPGESPTGMGKDPILRNALSIAVATGVYAVSYGVLAVSAGFSVAQRA
jgi:hypothetical protein